MSAERVVDECERLIKEYGANYITFIDDNFFVSRKRAENICEGIIRRNLHFEWFAEIRADFFKKGFIDSEFLVLAQRSGLRNLTIGAESGVSHCLEEMAKGITVEDIIRSAEMLAKTDISAVYSFIIGLPNETEKDIVENLRFIEYLRKIYPGAVCSVVILSAYPKTEFTEHFIREGWIKEPQSLRDFANPEFNKVYTSRKRLPIWHSNPKFAYYVACYAEIAYGSFNRESVRKHLRFSSVLLFPEMMLQKLALWRLKHRFFGLQLDLYVFRFLHWLYFVKWLRRLVKWAK